MLSALQSMADLISGRETKQIYLNITIIVPKLQQAVKPARYVYGSHYEVCDTGRGCALIPAMLSSSCVVHRQGGPCHASCMIDA